MNSADQSNARQTHAGLPRARARFLAQAIQLEEQGISDVVRVSIYTIMGLIKAFQGQYWEIPLLYGVVKGWIGE